MKEFEIDNLDQLQQVAKEICDQVPAPQCFALHGNLGSGKTTFVKAFATAAGITEIVTSPTYSIVNEYGLGANSIFHLDLYRLNDFEEALNIGIEEILDHTGYVFIEWPEIIDILLPDNTINLYFSYTNHKRSLKRL